MSVTEQNYYWRKASDAVGHIMWPEPLTKEEI